MSSITRRLKLDDGNIVYLNMLEHAKYKLYNGDPEGQQLIKENKDTFNIFRDNVANERDPLFGLEGLEGSKGGARKNRKSRKSRKLRKSRKTKRNKRRKNR